MSINRLFRRAVLLVVAFAALTQTSLAAADAVATLSIQAKLFQSKSGTFTADVLAAGAPELVNVVARDDPSTSSLVVVAVALADGKVLPADSSVRLVARERASHGGRARTVVDKTVPLGSVSKGGTAHLGFWLSDVGCRAVELKVTMTVARQPVSLSAASIIPFICNE